MAYKDINDRDKTKAMQRLMFATVDPYLWAWLIDNHGINSDHLIEGVHYYKLTPTLMRILQDYVIKPEDDKYVI